jgi:hypothetical protein
MLKFYPSSNPADHIQCFERLLADNERVKIVFFKSKSVVVDDAIAERILCQGAPPALSGTVEFGLELPHCQEIQCTPAGLDLALRIDEVEKGRVFVPYDAIIAFGWSHPRMCQQDYLRN